MLGGFSGAKGIILYNTDKIDKNAVYGFYNEKDEIVIIEGHLDELKKIQKKMMMNMTEKIILR